MSLSRRALLGTVAAAPLVRPARAQGAPIKIGVLNDQSGVYRDISGQTSTACVRQAIEDFGAQGLQVEVISGDHQNKPDIGTSIARQWIDRDGVDMIIDVPNSALGLAINGVCKEKDRVYINSTAATSDLTGSACSPTTVHMTYDTWMLAHSTGAAMVKAGGDSWFFVTADYAFGTALERDTTAFVKGAGGTVIGSVRHPFPGNTDFSSFLLQAQASKAKVIGICNAGTDTVNTIKQAAEFGITQSGTKLAGLLVFINDVHALGLQAAQGLLLTEAFYWDLNEGTRAWTRRYAERMPGRVPTENQAGVYSSVLAYLRAVKLADSIEGERVIEAMRRAPIEDPLFGTVTVRPDGRAIHAMHIFRVKAPAASKSRWDLYELVSTIPPEQAFRPIEQGGCPMVAR